MQFALGFIAGIATATLIVATIAFFKRQVLTIVDRAAAAAEKLGPSGRGGVFFPKDDVTVAREEIIRRNAEQGRDTPISELM